jgi:vancomycin permeability regulator SanA
MKGVTLLVDSRAHGGSRVLSEALPRGVALFLGTFCLLNLVIRFRGADLDGNLLWIDLRFLPRIVAQPFLLLAAMLLVGFALRPAGSASRRRLTLATLALLALSAVEDTLRFYGLFAHGNIHPAIPIAFSTFVLTALATLGAAVWRRVASSPEPRGVLRLQIAGVFIGCALVFPVLQMFCFGKTDYRRLADAAVVLGARAYADGRPSDALSDRVRTACGLYKDGLVHKLIFSGGPGDGAISESQAMKRMALKLGVKPEDIVLDELGVNTRATVRNTESLFHELHVSRVLVVSHFYHLPRVKLAYHQAGTEVYTVPAREGYLLRQLPYNMAREIAAFWTYYLRPAA